MLFPSLVLTLCLLAPAPPSPPVPVVFDFSALPVERKLVRAQEAYIGLEVVAADGEVYWGSGGLSQDGVYESRRDAQDTDFTEKLAQNMTKCGLKAEVTADKNTIRVTGWPTKDGKPRAVVLGRIWARGLPPKQLPTVKNPPPPPVEFDLTPIPLKPGGKVGMSFELSAADGSGEPVRVEATYEQLKQRSDLADEVAGRFTKAGLKAEAAGDRVRVVGWAGKDGKVRPAAAGRVSAEGLAKEQLPRVTGLPPAMPCVVFDFSTLTLKPAQQSTIWFEVETARGGEKFREQMSYMGAFQPADVSLILHDTLIRAGFHAERDGAKVRVFGWVRPGGRLFPVTGGSVECKELKPEELPTVTNPKKQP